MDVPVQRNGTQVEYTGSGTHDVECNPGIAELRPENPILQEIVDDSESHDETRDEKVSDGQTRQEEIAYPSEASVGVYGDAD